MVKFGKELLGQLVPEWQDTYCSYEELKNDLKRIKQQRTMGPTYTRTGSLGLLRSLASIKPGLTNSVTRTLTRRGRPDYMVSFSSKGEQHSKDTIVINKFRAEDGSCVYVTELQEPLSQSPQDRTFFARLDAQLTKVNKFYKKKEAENIARAGALEKQMVSLINLQEVVARQGLEYTTAPAFSKEKTRANDGDELENLKESFDELPLIHEDELQMQTFPLRSSRGGNGQILDSQDDDEADDTIQDYIDQVAAKNLRSPGHGEVRFQVDSNVPSSPVTPRSALKKVSTVPEPVEDNHVAVLEAVVRDDDIENQKSYSQKELDQAKKVLRLAFVEFYRGLGLLSNYRSVNITAFAKILKKYDKITGWNFAPIYMKEVESSHFVVSKKIHKLMSKVEDIYTKHFTEGERKKAISQLRPTRKQGTHRTTFALGLFSGCSISLFISFFFLVSNPMALSRGGGTVYLDTVFPVFSTLMLVAFHMYFYGFNVYTWQGTRINYPFIFGFSPGTELRYREVLLLSTGFTTFLLGGMNIHIAVTLLTHPTPDPSGVAASPSQHQSSKAADIIPLLLVLISLAILFFPFNTMYRSSRAFFLGCFRRLALAPWFKVVLADFFLGDQFTSQVLVFRNLEFVACFYSSGFFLTKEDQACKKNSVYQGFGYVVAMLPFWWRFLQCLRRFYDEKDKHQLQNAGKYMSAIVAVGLRQAYTNYRYLPRYELPLRVLFIIASIFATIFTSYWDFCIDWGLLNPHSRNKWLRDKLILRKKSIYFAAIGANGVLRLAWLATLLQVQVSFGFNQNAFDVIMASLEVLRRGIWNFFRIENEHLNNVGKYRAEKAVPLPFNDDM